MAYLRLQRYLSRCGLGSRRACEELITGGRVKVNGLRENELGTAIDTCSEVMVDGRKVDMLPLRYFMVNKPKGIICVRDDPKGRRWVVDLLPKDLRPGMFPVGRLDMDTTGLIIVTNDGELSNRISHPRYEVEKEYIALVKGHITGERLKSMEGGVRLESKTVEGIRILSYEHIGDRTSVALRIHEGRYHVVKRVFSAMGAKVLELHRRAVGDLDVDDLEVGRWREVDRPLLEDRCLKGGHFPKEGP